MRFAPELRPVPPRARTWLQRKPVDQVRQDIASDGLKRALGPAHLMFMAVGTIIGAGIYVMTGTAAASYAGPGVMISFVLAGIACTFCGLCYAEMASTLPAAGSAYTYSYATLGEVFAWIMGWLLVLEFGVAAAMVSTGWSGYLVSLLGDAGIAVPVGVSTPLIAAAAGPGGAAEISIAGHLNLIAALPALLATGVLVLGVSESAKVNNLIVFIKVSVLVVFVGFGVLHVRPGNWHPLIPPNEGGLAYGWPGVFRATSVIFVAYLGFETVSTAAAESRRPQRDVPFAILGSLVICTLLYVAVAAVLTGLVPFRRLGVPDPLAVAVDVMHLPWLAELIKIGAVIGLLSVILVQTYSQTRVFFAMARDGLLPPVFARLHPRFRTPWIGTVMLGASIALASALLPISILGDLVSLGTATAFAIVCMSVMFLRTTRPELPRPFGVPFGGVDLPIGRGRKVWIGIVPVCGVLCCLVLVGSLCADVLRRALHGSFFSAILLLSYALIGAAAYVLYGRRHSHLTRGL